MADQPFVQPRPSVTEKSCLFLLFTTWIIVINQPRAYFYFFIFCVCSFVCLFVANENVHLTHRTCTVYSQYCRQARTTLAFCIRRFWTTTTTTTTTADRRTCRGYSQRVVWDRSDLFLVVSPLAVFSLKGGHCRTGRAQALLKIASNVVTCVCVCDAEMRSVIKMVSHTEGGTPTRFTRFKECK